MNKTLSIIIAVVLLLPALYLFYSVRTYFGFKRAYGIDHFDASYRNMPFVKQGIFRFTSNAMYTFGFFLLWVPGFLFLSQAALLAALFNHSQFDYLSAQYLNFRRNLLCTPSFLQHEWILWIYLPISQMSLIEVYKSVLCTKRA